MDGKERDIRSEQIGQRRNSGQRMRSIAKRITDSLSRSNLNRVKASRYSIKVKNSQYSQLEA